MGKAHRSQHEAMHYTFLHKPEGEPRRNKNNCCYYIKDRDGYCVYKGRHCSTSMYCNDYKERTENNKIIKPKKKGSFKKVNNYEIINLRFYLYTDGVNDVYLFLDDGKYKKVVCNSGCFIKKHDEIFETVKNTENIYINGRCYAFKSFCVKQAQVIKISK